MSMAQVERTDYTQKGTRTNPGKGPSVALFNNLWAISTSQGTRPDVELPA